MTQRYGFAVVVGAVLAFAGWVAIACSSPSTPAEAGPRDAAADSARDAGPATEGGVPSLTSLTLSTSPGASSPVPMVPAFSSTVHDYYVRCAAGMNSFELSMTSSAGASSQLTQPTSSPSAQSQTLAVDVAEGHAIVAVARRGTVAIEYWVRCLPHDFPEMSMTTHAEAGQPRAGYYLLGNESRGAGSGYAMVLDVHGVPVWFVRNPSSGVFEDVDEVVPGALSYFFSPVQPWQIALHTLSPPSTSYIAPDAGVWVSRHELRHLSNGHFLVILPPNTYGVDMTGVTIPLPDGGTVALGPSMTIQDCDIVEFDSTGEVYSTWVGSEHIDVAKETVAPLVAAALPDGGLVMDPIHCNSIDLDPTNENMMLVSAKCTDAISYVDRVSGRILWKMGGTAYSKDDAVIVPVDDAFHGQHDARFQAGWSSTCSGGSGPVSVFDDETTTGRPARGVVYEVTVGVHDAGEEAGEAGSSGADDCGVRAAAPSARRSWQFSGAHNSSAMGSFRILSDGSRVVGWGVGNVPNLVFTEVDGDRDVLDFYFTEDLGSYRAIKVPLATFDLEVLRSTAGQP